MGQSKSKSKSKQKDEKPPKDKKEKQKSKDKGKSKSSKSKKQSNKQSKNNSKIQDIDLSKKENLSQQSFFKPFLMSKPTVITDHSVCQFHDIKNTIFCQICQQSGCQSCLLYGPHNNQMHRVGKIEQIFKARYIYLNELVCNDLIQKRDKLHHNMEQLMLLSDQLRYIKGGIEKITKVQFNQMIDRLKVSSGGKLAVLHHEMAQLQKDLQGINALGNQFFQLTNVNPEQHKLPETNPNKGIIPFLLRSKFLQQQAEQLISKPIKTSIDVYPYDLPREITQKKLILDKNQNWIDLLKIKNEAIWILMRQRKQLNHRLWNKFQEQATQQIHEWEKLKERISNELILYDMKCQKCKIVMNQETINEPCASGQYHIFIN